MINILLIEPDVLLADTYRIALGAAGYQVRLATNAQSAICSADEVAPDIIILEIHLVRHNGFEFLYELRSYTDWQRIPVIMLSYTPAAEFADCWRSLHTELGVHAYLYKPQTNLHRLLQTVRELSIAMEV